MRRTALAATLLAVAGAGLCTAALAGRETAEPPTARRAPVAAHPGLAVWAANGCGSCHTFAPAAAKGQFGPDLTHSLSGMPPEAIRTAIVDPGASAAAGWESGMMPADFGERIAPADLDRLVAFLLSAER